MNYHKVPVVEILKCYGIWDQSEATQGIIQICLKDYYGDRTIMKLLHRVS